MIHLTQQGKELFSHTHRAPVKWIDYEFAADDL